MTIWQILLFAFGYLIAFGVVIWFTRPTARRVLGTLAAGLAAGAFGMGAIAFFEARGLWHVPFAPTPFFRLFFYLGLAISLTPIYLVTWRLVRRFGWRGLAVFTSIVAVIGPPRDYFYAHLFPKWMVFAAGVAPVLADAAAYIGIVLLGHFVMTLIAGPAGVDALARQPRA